MVEGIHQYLFQVEHAQEYSHRRERVRAFFQDAHGFLDILKEQAQPMPLMAPIPDREIRVMFKPPLSNLTLERLAQAGYRCEQYNMSFPPVCSSTGGVANNN